jgi:hypothetical protein
MITPLGISFIEGNHRILLASKLLYGQKLKDVLPFEMKDDFNPVPEKSPLYQKIPCIVVFPKTDDDQTNKQNITSTILENCTTYSQSIASRKTHFIDMQWKDFLENLGNRLLLQAQCSMSEEVFINLPLPSTGITPKAGQEDLFEIAILKIAEVASTALFEVDPAKAMTNQMQYDKDKKQDVQQVDKEAFLARAIAPNLTNYRHKSFGKVSQMSTQKSTKIYHG